MSVPVAAPPGRTPLGLLLWPKIRTIANSMNRRLFFRRLPFTLFGVLFWVMLYLGTFKTLSYIREIQLVGDIVARKLIHMIFFSLFGFLTISNLITAVSSFYLSRDLPLLRTISAETGGILRLKTVETLVNSSWMTLLFIPPVFIAFGVSYGSPPAYYASVFTALVLLALISGGLGITAAHVLTRLFPARGARDMLVIFVILLGVVIYFGLRSGASSDTSDPLALLNRLISIRVEYTVLPSYWAAAGVGAMRGGLGPGGGGEPFYLLVLGVNAAFFLAVSEAAGLWLFGRNIEGVGTKGGRGKPVARASYPGFKLAVIYKDLKVFLRDRGQWSQLLIVGSLALIYVFNFRSIPVEAISEFTPLVMELVVGANLLMAGLVLTAVAARFIFSSVSLEGQAFWVVKSSPMGMGRFLWSKFFYSTGFVAVLITGIVLFTNLSIGVGGPLMAVSLVVTAIMTLAVGGLGTGMGAVTPKFRHENIVAVSMSVAGMSFMLIAFALILMDIALIAWPYYLVMKAGGLAALSAKDALIAAACVLTFAAINAAAFYVPMRLGVSKLNRMSL